MARSWWVLWSAVLYTADLSTALQILLFLPLTLVTLSTSAFLLLSLLLAGHALIHGTLIHFWGSGALSVLQVPMHPFLLLVCFNVFSSSVSPWLTTATTWWGNALTFSGPLFITMEGLSTLLVVQRLANVLAFEAETKHLNRLVLLIGALASYVISAWWITLSYPAVAVSLLSFILLVVAIIALFFLTFIGLALGRTNITESAGLALFIAYNVWLCGFDQESFTDPASAYAPLLPDILPHFHTLSRFVVNTLPKPVLIALIYRLTVLHLASRILPTIAADTWESEAGVDGEWDDRLISTRNLTRILLTYRQFIFVAVYSHLLLLDHSSQLWWRWMNIFLTLLLWAVELRVSSDEEIAMKEWKVD